MWGQALSWCRAPLSCLCSYCRHGSSHGWRNRTSRRRYRYQVMVSFRSNSSSPVTRPCFCKDTLQFPAAWILERANDVKAWPSDLREPLLFGSLQWIHFSTPVTMQWRKYFLFCRWSSCSQANERRSTSLGFKSEGTEVPCFWSIPNAFNCLEMAWQVTASAQGSSFCVCHRSFSSKASSSASSKVWPYFMRTVVDIEINVVKATEPSTARPFL